MKKSLIGLTALTLIFLSFLIFLNPVRTASATSAQLTNPLQWDTVEDLIKAIATFLRNLALAVTPIIIIVAGYYFVTSMGDPARITSARKMVLYAMIGLGIILVAEAIVVLIKTVIGAT